MAAEKLLRLSGTSSTSSAAGTMRLKRLIKPPAQPVVLDFAGNILYYGLSFARYILFLVCLLQGIFSIRFKRRLEISCKSRCMIRKKTNRAPWKV